MKQINIGPILIYFFGCSLETGTTTTVPEPKPHPNLAHFGVRSEPNRRFVWNSYLLSKVEEELHPDWILYIMHGFISQSNVSIFGRSVYIAIIARRSNKYAGTRFLKRGANFEVISKFY